MQNLNLQLRGLYTHPNPLSEVPQGALLKANNCVMDKEGIVETRRGFKKYGTALSGQIKKLLNYQDYLIVHNASTMSYDSDGLGTWSNYSGSYSAPTGAINIRELEASKNLYFTTSAGIKKLDSISGTIVNAGGIKALDATAALNAAVTGFMANNNQVAYRILWGFKDANENLILGAPSQRIVIANTSGTTKDIDLTITIPSGITTSHFYQIYRSVVSGGATITPNDELGLVIEDYPTSGEISAGSLSVTDSTPESLRGATLYTSPSQQGIAQSNDQPPLAQDIAYYKNCALYANTLTKQRINITLIAVSVGGSPGIAVNDTVVIGGKTYTAKNAENAANAEFKVEAGLTPAENIDLTAQSFVRVINKYSGNTVYYAYYMSGYNDLPGKILIEERSIGGASLALTASNGSAFNPSLPTSGTSISTSNETAANRVYVSKPLQPESVPTANYIDIGSANKKILRIIPLRDSVFVFKEDGLYRITGEELANYSVSLFDATVILTAPESAVAFNNQIFAYTSQGVVGISDTGVAILSRPVEVDLLPISEYANFDSISFGVAYNSDRKYLLWMQSSSSDTYPKQAYVYNALSQQWTRWEKNFRCGVVNSGDDRLYFGAADSYYVYQERKTYTTADQADEELAVTIVSSSGAAVVLSSTTGIAAGNVLYQNGRKSIIISVDTVTDITVTDTISWKAGAATVYTAIPVEIETIQQTAGNPGILKQFRDICIFFRRANFNQLSIGVKSDFSNYLDTTEINPLTQGSWGAFPWGAFGWGGGEGDYQAIRTFVPRNKQRCHWISINISHTNARDYFAVAGLNVIFKPMSERFK